VPRSKRSTWFSASAAAGFRWLLVLLVVVAVAWVWWQSRIEPTPSAVRPPVPATNRPPAARPPPAPVVLPPKPALTSPPPAVVVARPLVVQTSPPPVAILRTTPPPVLVVTSAPPVVVRSNPPAAPDGTYPRPVQNAFEAQVALDRQAISAGCIDGVMGSQTHAGLETFQAKVGLPKTGKLDPDTRARLLLETPPTISYRVTSNDLASLQPMSATWLGKSQQTALDYESALELVAEKSRASQKFLRQLNPGVDWSAVRPGTELTVPDAGYPEPRVKAAFVTIRLGARVLEVWDAQTNLLAHFPCSIAAKVDKRPVGELHVAVMAPNPNYTFNPEVFPESAEAQALGRKLILPPGPNNPVGVAWIGLDRPGYGIHGTPSPEQVGRTESHGCFRLANWNAAYLVRLAWVGLPVYVEP
jgi:lipoprotein-anchoring transpeptidase ErfK/SrfK